MASFEYQPVDDGDPRRKCCETYHFRTGLDLPVPKQLSDEEIKVEAQRFSNRVLLNSTKLNACMKRFESIIYKRWLKKSPAQRRNMLLQAWPHMSKKPRSDFANSRAHRKKLSPTHSTETYLFHYINAVDLQKDHLLLLFLFSRSHNLPITFVEADLRNAHRGPLWPEDVEVDALGMEFGDGLSPQRYGRLVVNQQDNTQKTLNPLYPPIVGLFILEVQDGIYDFLVAICKTILHDYDPSQWMLAPVQESVVPPPPPRFGGEWLSAPALAFEAPYRKSELPTLQHIQLLIESKCFEAKDHIFHLRDDPAYFVHHWTETRWHDDQIHCADKGKFKLNGVCSFTIAAAVTMGSAWYNFHLWQVLSRVLGMMRPLEVQLRDADPSTGRLNEEDEWHWAGLDAFLEEAVESSVNILMRGMWVSPKMLPTTDLDFTKPERIPWQPKPKCSHAVYRIHSLFTSLITKEQIKLHGFPHIVQEIQYMIDTDNEANDLLDEWVLSKFSDLAVVTELQRQLKAFTPWVRAWRSHKQNEQYKRGVVEPYRVRDDNYMTLFDLFCRRHVDLIGNPSDETWAYPMDKRRSKATTDQMRATEAHFSKLWGEIDAYFKESKIRLMGLAFPQVDASMDRPSVTNSQSKHQHTDPISSSL